MIWSGQEIAKILQNLKNHQIQPCGIDLTIDNVTKLKEVGEITQHEVKLPTYEDIPLLEDNKWYLEPGPYIIRYEQIIKIPENAAGIVLPRSSLLRMGANIFTALWDPGYEGRGISLLYVFNKHGIRIEKGARVAQLILIDARSSGKYSGRYQKEGL